MVCGSLQNGVVGFLILAACFGAAAPVAAEEDTSDSETIRELAEQLRIPDRTVRYKASLALGKIGESAIPVLIEALRDPDYEARVYAANALRDMKEKAAPAVGALAENLSCSVDRALGYPPKAASLYGGSPSLQVRWAAVAALGHMGPAAVSAIPALLETLRGDHEAGLAVTDTTYAQKHWRAYEMRGAAAWVIQKLGPIAAETYPEVIPALAAALNDPKRMVRLNAAAALRAMGPAAERAVPELLEALEHEDQFTRVYAARAFTALGHDGAEYVPALITCRDAIKLDTLSRKRIHEAVTTITGATTALPAMPAPAPSAVRWHALDREDFFLVVQPYTDSVIFIDPDKLMEAFLGARMGNAITCWPDHTWYNIPLPTADELEHWGMGVVWYFFTEDIFNPKLQRDWGFATVDDYNLAVVEQILETGRVVGKERAIWAVGHEQMDALHGWWTQKDGSMRIPMFKDKKEGYEFYRKWITRDIRKRHWMEYGNTRPAKFFDGWDTGAPSTWEFIQQHHIDTSPVTMASGGVSCVLAHASFDILPKIGMYWWECQVDGASLQVGTAYLRGAARQYGKKWLLDASPWSRTYGSPGWGYEKDGTWPGGVTDEQLLRTWTYGYLAGADAVLEESSGSSFFRIEPYPDGPSDKPVMGSTGRTAQEAARFCFDLCPDRGEPYNPVAVLLEQEHGFEPRPHTNFRHTGAWGFMPKLGPECEIEKFWFTAFPGHSSPPDETIPEDAPAPAREHLILTESAFGDCFDVLTTEASATAMAHYPRLMTLGGIKVDATLLTRLEDYVKAGGELVVNANHLRGTRREKALFGVKFGKWERVNEPTTGFPIEVREVAPTHATVLREAAGGRPLITVNAVERGKAYLVTARHGLAGIQYNDWAQWMPDVSEFLRDWIEPVWPVRVTTTNGRPPQVMLNKRDDGWLVTIGNHRLGEWHGDVKLDLHDTNSAAVTELWTQTGVAHRAAASSIRFAATVPQFTYRVYHVKTN